MLCLEPLGYRSCLLRRDIEPESVGIAVAGRVTRRHRWIDPVWQVSTRTAALQSLDADLAVAQLDREGHHGPSGGDGFPIHLKLHPACVP